MSLWNRASRAAAAFRAGEPSKDAVALRSMPAGDFAKTIRRTKKRIDRMPTNYRLFEPASIQEALDTADRSGVLGGPFGAAAVAKWVRSNPVVHGVTSPLFDFTHGPVNVLHSEEAAALLEGTANARGLRTQICDPAELENMAVNRHHCGWCVGMFIWNDCLDIPEFQSLDPAGVRYIPGEDRYEYHAWSKVFKIEPGNGIWVFDELLKNAPWTEGAWQRLGNDCHGAINAAALEALWQQMFAIPWVWAVAPQGASDAQKARFWQSAVGGAVLRVLGVTPGYDLKFLQATAEGKDSFAASDERLERHCSIDTWGTIGLIAGGSGFANEKQFREAKAGKVCKEARRQSRMENPQIWAPVLDWAVRAGKLSPAARNAVIEYQVDSAGVIEEQAAAAKALIEIGWSQEEACQKVGLSKAALPVGKTPDAKPDAQIFAYHIEGGIVTPNEVRATLGLPPTEWGNQPKTPDGIAPSAAPIAAPEAREDEEPEPTYSEGIAAALNERGEAVCPCPNHADRHCPRCGVVRRHELREGQWAEVWHATRRRAA